MNPGQTINRKVEVTNMKSKEINTGITLTKIEAESISKKLVAAGIDKKLIDRVIGGRVFEDDPGCTKAGNCEHCGACDKFFKVAGPSDIAELRRQLIEKKIDIKKIHPKAEKLFRG